MGTNSVLQSQKPTLLMVSAATCSLAASRATRPLRVPPCAARSSSTAASATTSFICDESMSEMSVVNRLFCPCQKRKKKRDDDGRYEALRGSSGSVEKSGLEIMIRIADLRFHLLPLGHVAAYRVHWRELRAHLLDDIFWQRGGFGRQCSRWWSLPCRFPLPVGTFGASPGNTLSSPPHDAVSSVLVISTSGTLEMPLV